VTDNRDERTGHIARGRHSQRPRPGDGPDLAPRPYQLASQAKHERTGAPKDAEGTGVWTPDWDDDDEPAPPPRRTTPRAAGRQPVTTPRQQGGARYGQRPPDPATRRYYVPPPSQRHSQGQPQGHPPGHPKGPRDPNDAPTDFIPRPPTGREELFTHREPDPPPLPPSQPYYRSQPATQLTDQEPDDELLRRKRIWRRVRRIALAAALLMFLGPIVAFLIGYFAWDVPNAAVLGASQQNQTVSVLYSDGQTELAKIVPQDENRINVELEQVPKHVQDAVLAAEDRSYWTNPGFDAIGIGRAVWKQATGGEGGGSTITQQYIKVATQDDDYSLRRKFRELVLSTKIAQQYSKEDILENYLNIVYFGRQAYGIQAASQAYFGKNVDQLSASEGALLAGMIQSPSRSDPTKNLPRAQARWNFVLDGMASQGWLDANQRSVEQFPQVVPLDQLRAGTVVDYRRHIQEKALAELEAQGFDTATVHEYGGRIVTTIDKRAQDATIEALNAVLNGQPPNLKSAVVAVDPKSGAVLAYYGGNEGTGVDLANSAFSPGSSFKAFVMLAALEQGKGLGDVYEGGSPLKIGGDTFNNS
jgi:Transglycosylase/Penicillin binding protein transpeptidase domain